jgi:hypothetical protein
MLWMKDEYIATYNVQQAPHFSDEIIKCKKYNRNDHHNLKNS